MRSLTYILSVLLVGALFLHSCVSDEDFPTPAGATFRLSADTIDLDTVLTHTASATRSLTLYNDNSKGLSITSVTIEGDDAAQFLANVDGNAISSTVSNSISIDCRGKDSLIAFVQFNAKEIDQDEAAPCEARLVFTLANGLQQNVVLQGYSQDAIALKGRVFTTDAILNATRPYVIQDSLVVAEGATLTLKEGTTLLFRPEAYLKVEGTLIANGSLAQPITMRGHRLDDMFEHQPYDRIHNQWQGIVFTSTSYDNQLNYCDIHSSNYGIICDSSDIARPKLRLENSILHNTKQDALHLTCSQALVGNTQISNAEGNCITVYGGDALFVHCTIASFSPFSAMRGNALVFHNTMPSGAPCPIERLRFANSIITGYAADEIYAYTDVNVANNYAFRSCLLCTPEITDNPDVSNCIWEAPKDTLTRVKNFIPFDLPALYFDFRLSADSKARNLADPDITAQYYPLDRLGRERKPTADAGCYQYYEE